MEGNKKYIVGGNWKCNGDQAFIRDIINNMMNDIEYNTQVVEVFFAPTTLHLSLCKSILNESFASVCAQDVSQHPCGAFTGEVSAEQLKDFDITLAILGHSERRNNFKETDEIVAEKVKACIENNIRPVICIGENLSERDEDQTEEVLSAQLAAIKEKVEDWSTVIIVYEPIWTFKTGKVATPEQIQESHSIIRKWTIENISEEAATNIRILYGGNITEKNCDSIIEMADVDGFLVGSTSIKKGFRFVVEQVSDFAESKQDD